MIKTIPVKFPDYEGVEVGVTTMEVPLCHLTPMRLNYVPYDDNWGDAARAIVFSCKHCGSQIEKTRSGLKKLTGEDKFDCL